MKEQLLKLQEVFAKAKGTSIELGLTDDAKKVVKEGGAIQKKLSAQKKIWTKIESEYGKVFSKILDFLDNTKGLTKDAEAIQNEANSLYAKLEKGAQDLGVDISDMPIARQLDEVGVDLDDLIIDIEDARKEASRA